MITNVLLDEAVAIVKLKVVWVESGLAWIPFLMQRLDHENQIRSCEAPMLKKKRPRCPRKRTNKR